MARLSSVGKLAAAVLAVVVVLSVAGSSEAGLLRRPLRGAYPVVPVYNAGYAPATVVPDYTPTYVAPVEPRPALVPVVPAERRPRLRDRRFGPTYVVPAYGY